MTAKTAFWEEEKMQDRRRYGVIEVRRLGIGVYHLTINGELWSEVEWSASRQSWCIQDAAGQCLAHVESIVGQDRDVQTAIRLAKRMIVSGEMPTPEQAAEAQRQRELQRRGRKELGEPMPLIAERDGDPIEVWSPRRRR
jgi:hypothetical protein